MRDSVRGASHEPAEGPVGGEGADRARHGRLPFPTYSWRKVGDDFVLVGYDAAAGAFVEGRTAGSLGAKASEMLAQMPRLVEAMNGCYARGSTTTKGVPSMRLFEEGEASGGRCPTASLAFVPPDLVLTRIDLSGEREDAGGAQKESEGRLQVLLEGSPDLISLVNHDNTVRYVSPAVKRLLGYEPEELEGKLVSDLVHPEDFDRFGKQIVEQIPSGVTPSRPIEGRYRHKDGSWRCLETTCNVLVDDPRAEGVVCASRDVTERKEAEEALKKSEERFRSLMQNSSDVISVYDADGTVRYVSPSIERVLGYDPAERIGADSFDLIHPDDVDRAKREFVDALCGPVLPISMEVRVRHKDGSWRHMEATGTNLLSDPDVRGVVLNSRDVTERKEAEEALKESEERFRSLMQNSSDIITVIRADGTIVYQTPSMKRALAHDPKDRVGKNIFTSPLIHPDDAAKQKDLIDQAIRDPGFEPVFEARLRHQDGSWRWVEGIVSNLLDDPSVRGIVLNSRDITERKRAEEALKESERRLRTVVGNVPVILFALDREGVFTLSEGKGLQALGLRPGEVVGSSVFETYRRVPEICEHVRRTLAGEEVVATVVVDEAVFEAFYVPVWDERGHVAGVIGVAADVTERQALEGRLRYQAYHDVLTGLPNRRLFVDRLGQALRRTGRGRGHMAAVLFMDLDGFKVVNDSLGHEVGDKLLLAVAERLEGCLRPEDTLARFGGDEFTVLVEEVEGPEDAVRVARRLTDCLREPFVVDGSELFVGASIGVALGGSPADGPEELLRHADTAMYRAKEDGSGCRLFDPEMYERVLDRLGQENDMRRALRADEFVVRYQPIVSLTDGKVRRVEALVRWEHPERGVLDPDEFVPLAEETGLIVPVGKGVLEEACRQGRRWRDALPGITPPVVSVNLSAGQLGHSEFVRTLERILRETGFEASRLSLDITETAFRRTLQVNAAALPALKRLGVGVSIDDFGAGCSSLAYLRRLPADALKIDRSFVRKLGEDAQDTAIVGTIVELAHALGMEAIAEGVESADQAERLKEMGCDHAQGFYFSEPLAPEALPKFLAR